MASASTLNLACRLLHQLDVHQSQGSTESQANDCFAVVETLGYYDLADHLRQLAGVPVFPDLPTAAVLAVAEREEPGDE